jgi:membrane fusion protein (multidrug efflux system)
MLKSTFTLTVLAAALLMSACGQEAQSKATPVTVAPASLELSATDVTQVTEQSLQSMVAITGQLQAYNYTTIQSETTASVAKVLVREGETVKKGQLIVQLATQDAESRLRQAEAALASAKAESILATAIKERNEQLHKDNYISDIEYKRGLAEAAARAENVKAQMSLVDIARKGVSNTVIMSPMSGIVSKRHIQAGQVVAMNSPLLDIVDLSQLELVATITPQHIAALKVSQEVEFTVQGFSQQFTANISRINPVADVGTRAVTFYASVNNAQSLLKSGLFVQGNLALGAAQSGLVVPQVAVRYDQDKTAYLWIVEQQKVVKRPVVLGTQDAKSGLVLINQGVKVGDKVVLAQLTPQAANMAVKIAE